jgi:2-phospho-L-lactate guanylyltransferase (CobY/MobA/RfbA family)
MALRRSSAASRGVPIEQEREEFVSHMAQHISDALSKGVTIKLRRKEFVSRMAQR